MLVKLTKGKRDRAKLVLQNKMLQEGLLKKTIGQLHTLEKILLDLEFVQVCQHVVDKPNLPSSIKHFKLWASKKQRNLLNAQQKKLEAGLEKDQEFAKNLLREQDRGKLVLQNKLLQEELLKKAIGELNAMEKMVLDLEFAQNVHPADKWNLQNIIESYGYWALGGALVALWLLFAKEKLNT